MRIAAACLIIILLVSCRNPGAPEEEVRTGPPEQTEITEAARALAVNGSYRAEALLIAAGPSALREVYPLLASESSIVRARAALVLLAQGEELDLTVSERVDLALFEMIREQGQPYSRMMGIEKMEKLGESARSALEVAAAGEGPSASMAQRLLRQEAEAK